MSPDWTEKYRPKSLSQVIGNPKAVSDLQAWARQWAEGKPRYRAAVLMGSPGVGKTTSAEALARDMGWDIMEMNASDQRTEAAIRDFALKGASSNTFSEDGEFLSARDGGLKLIVLDEADSLSGTSDKGAVPAIGELIRQTKQPVILIVNDFYEMSRKSSIIKSETLQITFQRPTATSIGNALKRICRSEDIEADDAVIKRIAENANGDMRAAVRDLESLSMGRDRLTIDDVGELTGREVKKNIFELMTSIFRKSDPMASRALMTSLDEEPSIVMLWVDENLPYEYKDPGDLIRGYEKLSRADIFLGRVHRRQYYGFWSYAGDMMSAGVASARRSSIINRERVRNQTYFTKLGRVKGIKKTKASLCKKMADYTHNSTKRVLTDLLEPYKTLFKNDPELRVVVAAEAGLDEDEVGFLMGEKPDSKTVKSIMASAKEFAPRGDPDDTPDVFEYEEDDMPVYGTPFIDTDAPPKQSGRRAKAVKVEPEMNKDVKGGGQTSLFDFRG